MSGSTEVDFCAFPKVAYTIPSTILHTNLEFARNGLYSMQQDGGRSGGEISSGYML